MRKLGTVLGGLFVGALSTLAEASASADEVALDPAALPPAWIQIAAELQSPSLVRAEFQEKRYSRLRRRPSAFDGDLYFSRKRGLSLRYEALLESVVIIDEVGVLRRAGGGERALPVPESEVAMHRVFLQLFTFDLAALNESFHLSGRTDEAGWQLRLEPREAVAGVLAVEAVELAGTGGLVERLRLDRPGGLILRIELSDHVVGGALEPAEEAARFR